MSITIALILLEALILIFYLIENYFPLKATDIEIITFGHYSLPVINIIYRDPGIRISYLIDLNKRLLLVYLLAFSDNLSSSLNKACEINSLA